MKNSFRARAFVLALLTLVSLALTGCANEFLDVSVDVQGKMNLSDMPQARFYVEEVDDQPLEKGDKQVSRELVAARVYLNVFRLPAGLKRDISDIEIIFSVTDGFEINITSTEDTKNYQYLNSGKSSVLLNADMPQNIPLLYYTFSIVPTKPNGYESDEFQVSATVNYTLNGKNYAASYETKKYTFGGLSTVEKVINESVEKIGE